MTRAAILVRAAITVAAAVAAGPVLLTSGTANRHSSEPSDERRQRRRHATPWEPQQIIGLEVEP